MAGGDKDKDSVGEVEGGWFSERVSRKVVDDKDTIFWYDKWLGEIPFCTRFSRLFHLVLKKLCTVQSCSL